MSLSKIINANQLLAAQLQKYKTTKATKKYFTPKGPNAPLFPKAKSKSYTISKLRTLTAKKRKNPMKRILVKSPVGGSPSFSSFKLFRSPSAKVKTMKKVANSNVDLFNYAYQVKANEGYQGAGINVWQGLVDLQRYAAQVPVQPSATLQQPRQFVVESVVAEMLLTNSSLATAYVDIYDIVRKRDTSKLPATTDPFKAWRQGEQDQDPLYDPNAWMNINALPTDSLIFKDYFKVIKRNHVALTGGATHRHMVNIKANELIDTALLAQLDGDPAGFSVYTMIVFYGQPASITDPENPSSTIVTTAKVAIDVVIAQRAKYTWIENTTRKLIIEDNLSTLAGEQIVPVNNNAAIVVNAQV